MLTILLLFAGAPDVHVVVAPPCLATFRASERTSDIAVAEAKRTGSRTRSRALGNAALATDARIVVPDPRDVDFQAPAALVSAEHVGDGEDVERTVLADALPALKSPEELAFALPGAPDHFLDDLYAAGRVRGRSPDLEQTTVRLVELTSKRTGHHALSVELGDEPAPNDPLLYDRTFADVVEVDAPAGKAVLVDVMQLIGGPARLKPALDDARAEAGDGALTIMPGAIQPGVGEPAAWAPRRDACAAADAAVAPDVVVPSAPDLALGVDGLARFTKDAHLVWAAANVKAPGMHAVVERDVQGKRVAVIGVVNPDGLEQVPPAARAGWTIEDPIAAVEDLVEQEMRGPRPPDLVIAVSPSPALLPKLALVPFVDVVIAGQGRTDALDAVTTVSLRTPREHTREPAPLLTALSAGVAVRTLTARFDGDALTGIVDEAPPVDGWSRRDTTFARPFRVAEERDYARDAPLSLPRLDDVLALAPAGDALARGQDIAYRGRFVTVAPGDAPIWSDALFHRMAANALREALDVDAAFTASTPRRSDLGDAAVPRRFVRDWLTGKGAVRTAEVRGDVLTKLAGALAHQASAYPPSSWIYASALDVQKGVIGGRKIDPAATYRIGIDDESAARADVAAILDKVPLSAASDAPGAADVVLGVLDRDGGDPGKIASLLADQSAVKLPEWRFAVEQLDVHTSGGQSSNNVQEGAFAATKESRAAAQGFSQVGAHAVLSSLYDSAVFAWESRLNVQYESVLLDAPKAVPQVQIDDVILSTEGRLNSISIHGGAGELSLVPFAQVAGETQVMPTPDPVDPTKSLPRQALVREMAGAAFYPGGVVNVIRLGLIVQHDLSDAIAGTGPERNDAGAGLTWHLEFPLWKLKLTSDVDTRYFVPDGDDRDSDLALRSQLVHRLAFPLTQSTSAFIYLDGVAFLGKRGPAAEGLGWNAIAGGGVTFGDVWRF